MLKTNESRFISEYEEVFGVLGYSPRQVEIDECELHTEYRKIAAEQNASYFPWE